MQLKTLATATALLLGTLPAISQARDTTLFLPFDQVVTEAISTGKIDGSVKFYLAGNTPAGKASVVTPGMVTNNKTNAFNKTDYQACSWALQSALITLHQAAKNVGANAVTDIASYYKKNERKDPKTYECHAGAVIAGVALKGNLAKVN